MKNYEMWFSNVPAGFRDRVMNTDMKQASQATMATLTALQKYPKDTQIIACAVLFLGLCRRFVVSPTMLLNCAAKMIDMSKRYNKAAFEATDEYIKQELGA